MNIIKMMVLSTNFLTTARQTILDWLVAHAPSPEYRHIDRHNGDTYIGEGWALRTTFKVGKYREWGIEYEIGIEDDLIAVEFMLIKDSL